MNKNDWGEFCSCLQAVAEITASKPKSKTALLLTFEALSGYSLKQVKDGIANHLHSDDGRFFPTPAHIIKQIDGSEAERANIAWRMLLKAVEKYGYYESVRFPAPAYHYAIDLLGGWVSLGAEYPALSEKELEFRRGPFTALYMRGEKISSFTQQPGKVKVKAYLPGFFEQDNLHRGFDNALPPVYELSTGKKIDRDAVLSLSGGSASKGRADVAGLSESVAKALREEKTND